MSDETTSLRDRHVLRPATLRANPARTATRKQPAAATATAVAAAALLAAPALG
jgi:hypothetical protein